jgi:hypothetical protein
MVKPKSSAAAKFRAMATLAMDTVRLDVPDRSGLALTVASILHAV